MRSRAEGVAPWDFHWQEINVAIVPSSRVWSRPPSAVSGSLTSPIRLLSVMQQQCALFVFRGRLLDEHEDGGAAKRSLELRQRRCTKINNQTGRSRA